MRGEYVTVRNVAERYQLHPCTVRRWIKRGLIRAITIGGPRMVRVRADDVTKLVTKLEKES